MVRGLTSLGECPHAKDVSADLRGHGPVPPRPAIGPHHLDPPPSAEGVSRFSPLRPVLLDTVLLRGRLATQPLRVVVRRFVFAVLFYVVTRVVTTRTVSVSTKKVFSVHS